MLRSGAAANARAHFKHCRSTSPLRRKAAPPCGYTVRQGNRLTLAVMLSSGRRNCYTIDRIGVRMSWATNSRL